MGSRLILVSANDFDFDRASHARRVWRPNRGFVSDPGESQILIAAICEIAADGNA
jgi:hypothetical protein